MLDNDDDATGDDDGDDTDGNDDGDTDGDDDGNTDDDSVDEILSKFIDLSNAYWLYGQYTRHINFRKVFGGFCTLYGH